MKEEHSLVKPWALASSLTIGMVFYLGEWASARDRCATSCLQHSDLASKHRGMCCFSGPVKVVENTRIFTRLDKQERQFVVYAMSIETRQEVAMVLPLPIKPGSGEDAVHFINLEAYPNLFDDMHKGFPEPRSNNAKAPVAVAAPGSRTLEVHTVGAFEASYVPTPADFSRLSRRFRLPDGTWEKLPGYAGFGFAVFKLKRGNHQVHPMAFSFPTAKPDKLFFPTLHIHDGEVHEKAEFDHTLYCQTATTPRPDWRESPQLAVQFMEADETQGIVLPNEHIYRRTLHGELANTDWLVKARAVV